MLTFLERIVRGSAPKAAEPGGHSDAAGANPDGAAPKSPEEDRLTFVLGLKWAARSKVERDELAAVETAIRAAGLADVVLDKIEPGPNELAFWLHTSNPKRAFKQLAELPPIAERLPTLQAAYAERSKLKFSLLWPKDRHPSTPHGLG